MAIEMPSDIAPAASKGVNRRAVLKAGAWAAPVVLLTTAVPAASASTGVITATLTQTAANGNRHNIFLNLTSTYATSQTVSITWNTLPAPVIWETGPATSATVAAGTSTPTATTIGRVRITGAPGTYTVSGVVTLPDGGTVPVSVSVTK